MLCVECGAAMRRTDEPITDVYKNEEITVEGIPHYKCDACGDTVMDADASANGRPPPMRFPKPRGVLEKENDTGNQLSKKF